jgi:hypothetical protein
VGAYLSIAHLSPLLIPLSHARPRVGKTLAQALFQR